MVILILLLWVGAEVVSVLLVGKAIGLIMALWLMAVISVIGLSLLGRAKSRLDPSTMAKSFTGQEFDARLASNLAPLIAGALLMFPGYVSDVFALAFVFPPTRRLLVRGLKLLGQRFIMRRFGPGRPLNTNMFRYLASFGDHSSFEVMRRDERPRPPGSRRSGEKVIDADYEVL